MGSDDVVERESRYVIHVLDITWQGLIICTKKTHLVSKNNLESVTKCVLSVVHN